MMMPEMDGRLLGKELRALRSRESLPLILLSSVGVTDPGLQIADLFSATVMKPVKNDQLYNIIMEVIAGTARPFLRTQQIPIEPLGDKLALTILVAEDNPVNQKLLIQILQRLGYTADLAQNGIEVLEAVEQKLYDIVFMDVHMPVLDGLEATRTIVSNKKREERPIIVAVTADAMEGDREICFQAGMDDYVTKPIRIADIQHILKRWGKNASK